MNRSSVVDSCALALRRAIVGGDLPPGERLPPERALAERFGVNRTTLRAALRQVAGEGLVAVRQGSGYTVRDFRTSGGPDLVPALIEAARTPSQLVKVCAELLAIRRALAHSLLESLLVRPPSETALVAVATAIDALEAAVNGPTSEVALADLAVVSAFVQATDSVLLGLFVNPVSRVLEGVPSLSAAMFADATTNVAVWRWLLEAIRTGTLDLAVAMNALESRDIATMTLMEATCSGS